MPADHRPQINVRLSLVDFTSLHALADHSRLSLSALLRTLILRAVREADLPPPALKAHYVPTPLCEANTAKKRYEARILKEALDAAEAKGYRRGLEGLTPKRRAPKSAKKKAAKKKK